MNRRQFLTYTAAALAGAGCSSGGSSNRSIIRSALFITDSIGAGYAGRDDFGYTWYLQNIFLPGFPIQQATNHFGRNSGPSQLVMEFLPGYIADYPPNEFSHVFINCGLWDARADVSLWTPAEEYLQNIQTITDELQYWGYEVIWLTTTHTANPERNGHIDRLNEQIVSLEHSHGVFIYDMLHRQITVPYRLVDGVHFEVDSVVLQAGDIAQFISEWPDPAPMEIP